MKSVIKNLSGRELGAGDSGVTFFDLGFDSLLLTQASQSLRQKFGVKITFRQLMENLVTIAAVSEYLDGQVPPDKFTEQAAPPAPAAAPVQEYTAPSRRDRRACGRADRRQRNRFHRPGGEAAVGANEPAARSSARQWKRPRLSLPEIVRTQTSSAAPRGTCEKIGRSSRIRATLLRALQADGPQSRAAGLRLFSRSISTISSRAYTRTDAPLESLHPAASPAFRRSAHRRRFPQQLEGDGLSRSWSSIRAARVSGTSTTTSMSISRWVSARISSATRPISSRGRSRTSSATASRSARNRPSPARSPRFFANSAAWNARPFAARGSEAVLAAVRLARTVTGRVKIATTSGYHGINDEVLVRANVVDGVRRPAPIAPGIPQHIVDEVLVLDYGTRRIARAFARARPRTRRRADRAGAEPPARSPAGRVSPRGAPDHGRIGNRADLRRTHHRLSLPSRRRAGALGHQGRHGHLRQGHRRRHAHRRDLRQGEVSRRARRRRLAIRRRFLSRSRHDLFRRDLRASSAGHPRRAFRAHPAQERQGPLLQDESERAHRLPGQAAQRLISSRNRFRCG